MAGDALTVTVWRSGALAPADAHLVPLDGLVLSRELLAPTDTSISRAQTAPHLQPRDDRSFAISTYESATASLVVIPGCRFDDFQRDVPPAIESWKVEPAQLRATERIALAASPGQAIALMRGLRWDDSTDPAWLMRIPAPVLVEPGAELTLGVPAIVLIGQCAIEVTGDSTPHVPQAGGLVLTG